MTIEDHDADGGDGLKQLAAQKARADGYPFVTRTPEVTRRLALLWSPPGPSMKGRPASTSLAEVISAGLAVVRAEGLEALSMRKVAKELGVGAMSLYTYVPGRAELIDLMIDSVYGGLGLPEAGEPWRTALAQYCRGFWALYEREPWLLQTNMWRAPLSPRVLDAQEAGLRTLIRTSLAPVQVVQTIGLVDTVLQGLARSSIAESVDRDASGVGQDDYWESMSSFWEDWFDVERYPVMTGIYLAGAFDNDAGAFETTLERLLDVVEMSIDAAAEAG
ncbi:TetR/AcrR family transcriptional regulator [Occultella aeris]|uniref:Bacterial regulatory proteins, tetR family n=1 Tax=Occultella aeris TaxID=2761496 RepID=A0A7M4DRL4_9MICO|nr:TetR/AcrR family transcriptional regulator [Occultella aeris]VZO40108.1 Bacterial regulatory proteins, tetR family [Occultella aeris]